MPDPDVPELTRQMETLSLAERNVRIVYGILAGKVVDARKRFDRSRVAAA